MIQALSKLAIPLELILMELTSMFENSFEDAKSLVLKIRTHLFIYTHTHLRPVPKSSQWTREKPSLLSHHVIHVIVGRCQVVSPSWSSCTHKLSESFFFPLIQTHSIIFRTYWSSVMHILIILFIVFLPAGLAFSLFLYWSLCPRSWCQSRFLQVHFKGIEPLVFHSQENNTEV